MADEARSLKAYGELPENSKPVELQHGQTSMPNYSLLNNHVPNSPTLYSL